MKGINYALGFSVNDGYTAFNAYPRFGVSADKFVQALSQNYPNAVITQIQHNYRK